MASGAKFVDVPYETDEERECAVGVGGYARPMPTSWMQRQALAVHERAKQADIVITTALIGLSAALSSALTSAHAVKEQIESLGAKFVDVPYETDEERECAVGVGGYARPMPTSWMQRQALAVHERAKQADIVITTALIPGRKAPTLLSADTVAQMKPGSVVIDLAAAQGGNCPLTVADQVVVENGVIICGPTNLAGAVAADASALYARNLLDFLLQSRVL